MPLFSTTTVYQYRLPLKPHHHSRSLSLSFRSAIPKNPKLSTHAEIQTHAAQNDTYSNIHTTINWYATRRPKFAAAKCSQPKIRHSLSDRASNNRLEGSFTIHDAEKHSPLHQRAELSIHSRFDAAFWQPATLAEYLGQVMVTINVATNTHTVCKQRMPTYLRI